MVRIALLAGLACAALLPVPVLAQDESPSRGLPPDSNIVVTGELPPHSDVTRQARAITAPTGLRHEPLPRFEGTRLCPGVIGMKADFAGYVVERIRVNAERFDLWMTEDDGTCVPNFIVAFVDDGQATLRQIEERWRWLFTDMPRHERLAMLEEDGPVHVWTGTEIRTRDGMPAAEDHPNHTMVVQMWSAHSKIYLPVRADITRVLVLIDRDAARDKTLLQLADYATMRGLARTRPVEGDGQAMDTILALFDPDATPPAGLTPFDRAYLASVYAGIPNLPGLTKVLGVTTQLRRQTRAEQAAAGE